MQKMHCNTSLVENIPQMVPRYRMTNVVQSGAMVSSISAVWYQYHTAVYMLYDYVHTIAFIDEHSQLWKEPSHRCRSLVKELTREADEKFAVA